MFCSYCPHCQQAQELSTLRLPRRDSEAFYVEFADRYRRARAVSRQPAKLLQEANPRLTAEQVKWYRRRCVDLGLLERVRDSAPVTQAAEASVAQPPAPSAPVTVTAAALEQLPPDMREWLARARATVPAAGLA